MRVDPEKLISALIASHTGIKLDYNAIARAYGEGANYNTIEHKFRRYRKEAEKLRAEADGSGSDSFTPQARQVRTPRSRQVRSEPNPTPTKRAGRRKTTKDKATPVVVNVDLDDNLSPVKPEIKRDSDAIRKRLGLTKIEIDLDSDVPVKKQKRDLTPQNQVSLPSLDDIPEVPRVNSQENGYAALSTATSPEKAQQQDDGSCVDIGEYEDV